MSCLRRITATVLSICMIFGLCSCSFDSTADKIISMEVDSHPINIDPQLATLDSELIIARNTMTGLFRIGENREVTKSLCEDFTISENRLEYSFIIKDAEWSNGEKITADDFVFGITRALNAETKSPSANSLFFIKNGEAFHNGEVDENEIGISAKDANTLEIILEYPVSDIEYRLADIVTMPCNREFFTECKGKYGLASNKMLYCGPFKVSSWTDKSIKMNRFTDYVGSLSKPASLTMTFGESSDEKINSITKGIIDIAVIDADKEQSAKKAGLKTESIHNIVWAVIVNPNAKMCESPLTASALFKSLDRANIERSLPSGYSMFSGLIAPDLNVCGEKYSAHISEYTQTAMDRDTAKQEYMQAIKELGADLNGTSLLYVNSGHIGNIAIKIAANWQSNLDAYINTEGVTLSDMKKRIKSGDFTLALYPIGYDTPDAESALEQFTTDNVNNIFGITNSDFDNIISSANDKIDADEKAKMLHNAEIELIAANSIYPIFLSPSVVAYTPSLDGFSFDLFKGNFDFEKAGK